MIFCKPMFTKILFLIMSTCVHKHYDFTTDKVCHSLKFIMQPVVIESKPFNFGYNNS